MWVWATRSFDRGGIRLVRAYGWGTKIYGKPDGEMWRREDPKRKEEFKNPLFELNAAAELIKNALKDQGMEKITVTPLVVFADNYQIPELYLGYGYLFYHISGIKGLVIRSRGSQKGGCV